MREGRFATIGTFDGVHQGHRLLLGTLMRMAEEAKLRPTAFILERHPLALVAPQRMPPQLSTFDKKARIVSEMGVEVIPLSFNESTRRLTSSGFMDKIADEFGVKALLIGHDNKIGCDRDSCFADYLRHGRDVGMRVEEAPALPGVSSSAVRKALLAGDVKGGAAMLGCPYALSGTVVHGERLGTRIGFPTANMRIESPELLVPAGGVYATMLHVEGEVAAMPAVTNIGVRPTVSSGVPVVSIETHIPGFSADIYGRSISLEFIDKIRDERRFPSLDALVERMRLDTQIALDLCLNSLEENKMY